MNIECYGPKLWLTRLCYNPVFNQSQYYNCLSVAKIGTNRTLFLLNYNLSVLNATFVFITIDKLSFFCTYILATYYGKCIIAWVKMVRLVRLSVFT